VSVNDQTGTFAYVEMVQNVQICRFDRREKLVMTKILDEDVRIRPL